MPPGAKRLEQLSNPVHKVDSNRNPDIRSAAGRWWKAKTEEDMLQEKKKKYDGNESFSTTVNSLTLKQMLQGNIKVSGRLHLRSDSFVS